MQVLRSNFLARGIGSDAQANDLATNYRIGAQIIRSDQAAFPNSAWKAVAAYNVGVYGAKIGRVPANNYTNAILQWRNEYEKAIAPYR
ncbi:MAG: transglycosylase SLT domain-containing protein [Elusimicrobia bacterium]|nr:transglycosylase SLT domain-containing protein [Elusimicrobiota bacterium]